MSLLAISVAPAFSPLSPAELARARHYLYGDLLGGSLAQLWMLLLLALAYFSGATAALASKFSRAWLSTALVVLALFVFVLVGLLPFDFYLDFARERAFGFQHLTASAWLLQWAASSLVTMAAGLAVVEVAYAWLPRRPTPRNPRRWWMRLWAVVAVGVVFAVAIDPVFIQPLFNHFTEVQDPALRARILALAERAGVPTRHVYEMDASRDSSHTNAYVVGILGSQRIVLYDTLLRSQTPAEIEFVVAHEIGHYVMHHLWKGVAFTLVYLFALFFLLSRLFPRFSRGRPPTDIAALPLILLLLLAMVYLSAPATNGFSRWEEHQADAYGLRLADQPCAAVASFEREEQTDLIYPNPPAWIVFWFFNHPSQQQRIDFANAQCKRP